MAVTMLMITDAFPAGHDNTERSVVLEGQLLPYNSANALLAITNVSLTSNAVTFTAANALTIGGGDVILVAGFTGSLAFLNGGYTTSSATATTIVVPLTHANLASTACKALATLSPNYATGGLALGSFVTTSGKTQPVPQIGPKNYPKDVRVFTRSGSSQNYKVNLNVQPSLVLDFTGITQATNGSAVPADSIGFRAEYVKDAY